MVPSLAEGASPNRTRKGNTQVTESRTYTALVLDLDGTLIGRDERITPAVARAVASVSQRVDVCIATGREPAHAVGFARVLGLTTPQVSDNGALILDAVSGRRLWSMPLGPDVARQVVAGIDRLGLAFIATHPGGTSHEAAGISDWNLTRVSALDMEEAVADDLVAAFESNPGLHVVKASLPYNGLWAVDFTRAGVTKATAVKELARMLGTSPDLMIAVGDSYNDAPLLEACGLGIAMGQAPDEVKAIADFVAPSVDEDGLAVAIEEFVLPRL